MSTRLTSKYTLSRAITVLVFAMAAGSSLSAQNSGGDLSDLSLEDLLKVHVTSAAKKDQPIGDAPVAIFVITAEDIRLSGAESVPELLRTVPGIEVARINSNSWSVTARGFSSKYADKLLVLLDGRSIYDPLFSGVFWDMQMPMLEDIERIEVIRGPGGTLWGANAFNGVINIITKEANHTQGGLIIAGGGTDLQSRGAVRYGGALGKRGSYRLFAQHQRYAPSIDANGTEQPDAWSTSNGGFRADLNLTPRDSLMVSAEVMKGAEDAVTNGLDTQTLAPITYADRTAMGTGFFLTRWTRTRSEDSNSQLQFYYNRSQRNLTSGGEHQDTLDVEFQQRARIGSRNDIVFGAGYRFLGVREAKGPLSFVVFNPDERSLSQADVFAQDEIKIVPNHLEATAGIKIGRNPVSGTFEPQPTARLLWTPNSKNSLWGAVSRAVRLNSLGEDDGIITLPIPSSSPVPIVINVGGGTAGSEHLLAYEFGYRSQPAKRIELDFAMFYSTYALHTQQTGSPFLSSIPVPHMIVPVTYEDGNAGDGHGVEVSATVQASERLRLSGAYSWLSLELGDGQFSSATSFLASPMSDPRNQGNLRASYTLSKSIESTAEMRFVDRIQASQVPGYQELNLQVAWHAAEHATLSIHGENLLHEKHEEFSANSGGQFISSLGGSSGYASRVVFGKLTFTF